MTYSPIRCDLYDYIEIACMRKYSLEVLLKTNVKIQGIAKNTRVKDKEEFIILEKDQLAFEIRLDKIKEITVLNENSEFQTVTIN